MASELISSPLTPCRRSTYVAAVSANRCVCREHFAIEIELSSFPPTEPGEFLQLQSSDRMEDHSSREWEWSPGQLLSSEQLLKPEALLNRPFSIAGRRDEGGMTRVSIIYRVVGVATRWLSTRTPGSKLTVIGPVGNRFSRAHGRSAALLVGGGAGIPPMIYCADQFRDLQPIAFCGAMSSDLLPLTITAEPDVRGIEARFAAREFAGSGVPIIVTTDDGSVGRRGFITDAVRNWLEAHRSTPAIIYACGPEPMLKAVAALAAEYDTPCQVAVERAMACGLGTCQSCIIRVRDNGGWKYKLSCTDGPVFDAKKLVW